jgi:hypothetical protein
MSRCATRQPTPGVRREYAPTSRGRQGRSLIHLYRNNCTKFISTQTNKKPRNFN